MPDENKPEVAADEKGNADAAKPEVEMVSVPKSEYDKLTSDLGSLKRTVKDLKKSKDEPKEEIASKPNDLGEKAFLAVNGVKTPEELAFFNKLKQETGKSADALLESTYFQSEFKAFKELKASDNATPNGSKRSSNSSVDTVEYWIAKGELPPVSEVELRRKVVNARMKKEKVEGQFYNS